MYKEGFAVTLYRVFDRPYWRRLWIIQELATTTIKESLRQISHSSPKLTPALDYK
jgi:hypothetical protein